jgi:hypothetical protein
MLALHALVRVVSKVEEEQKEIIGENIQNSFLLRPVAPKVA